MSKVMAVRGATTLTKDDSEEMDQKVKELIQEIYRVNLIDKEQVVSAFVTATADIKSKFPATSARIGGLEDVPILGAQEVDIEGGLPFCVRVLLHVNISDDHNYANQMRLKSVYLHEAKKLRPDLAGD